MKLEYTGIHADVTTLYAINSKLNTQSVRSRNMVVDGELVAEPLYGWLSSNYKACDLTYLTGASLLLFMRVMRPDLGILKYSWMIRS